MNKAEQDALFGRLFNAHRQPIYGYLYNLLGDLMRAEELVQDVFECGH